MTNIALIVIGVILGLALNLGLPYYFVSTSRTDPKSTVVSVLLSLVLGPFIGFSYARPASWALALVTTVCFYTPIGIAAGVFLTRGNVALGGAFAGYFALTAIVTAVLITQDQNEEFDQSLSV